MEAVKFDVKPLIKGFFDVTKNVGNTVSDKAVWLGRKIVVLSGFALKAIRQGFSHFAGFLRTAHATSKVAGKKVIEYSHIAWNGIKYGLDKTIKFSKFAIAKAVKYSAIALKKLSISIKATAGKIASKVHEAWVFVLPYLKQAYKATKAFLKTPLGQASVLGAAAIAFSVIASKSKSKVVTIASSALSLTTAAGAGFLMASAVLKI